MLLANWPLGLAAQPNLQPSPPAKAAPPSEQAGPTGEPLQSTGRWRQLFSAQNAGAWLATHGLAIAIILSILAITLWVSQWLQGRLIALLALRGGRGTVEERQARSKTLVGVLHNALRTAAVVAAAVMILEELSVPVGPILGGAAVVGLAVAFGAQSLIKDYFTGFMVLIEQQYVIGDVVQIGDTKGQVERITLRLTMLPTWRAGPTSFRTARSTRSPT